MDGLLLLLLVLVVGDGIDDVAGDAIEGAVFDAGFNEAHCEEGWMGWHGMSWCWVGIGRWIWETESCADGGA